MLACGDCKEERRCCIETCVAISMQLS